MKCTKDTMILNDLVIVTFEDTSAPTPSSYTYGRKVDMLIQTAYERDTFDVSANEWKHTGTSQQIVLKQQVINILSNVSILYDTKGISSIPAIDVIG